MLKALESLAKGSCRRRDRQRQPEDVAPYMHSRVEAPPSQEIAMRVYLRTYCGGSPGLIEYCLPQDYVSKCPQQEGITVCSYKAGAA